MLAPGLPEVPGVPGIPGTGAIDMKRAHAGWLLLAAVALGAGCSSSRPIQRGSTMLVEPLEARRAGFAPRWSTDLGVPANEDLSTAEVLGDVLVTTESPSNLVSAVSLRDGGILWRRVVGDPASRLYRPVRVGDSIYISTDSRL